jgi:integrase/recombinase XerD
VAWGDGVSTVMALRLGDYLAMRRGLGFKLQRSAALLTDFVAFLDDAGATTITTDLAVAWARQPVGADACWWAARLSAVRVFARYLAAIDPDTQVPSADLMPSRPRRATPFLYAPDDVAALMAAAGRIPTRQVAATYRTLIGLLAVTGMRVGEAIGLDRDDFDSDEGLLVVRKAKFGKSREVVLHPSTSAALQEYTSLRGRLCPRPGTPAFFVSATGTRLIYKNVHHRFHALTQAAGLRPRSAKCRPRPHDLRHTFAVNTLLGWYQVGVNVQARLPLLSTYLGHIHPGCTYWYLSATPELLALVADRLGSIGPEPQ